MDLKKYIYGHCVSPVKIRVWDSYSNDYQYRLVPCGQCLHCRNTHVNEWCTRLFAQKAYSKYCYFVSLDYKPFTEQHPSAVKLIHETAACLHNINSTKKMALHPLVLCKNHLQDFYKRLRKNTNVKLQYFACGEYGTHALGRGFGRPHFHNIIFSNDPLKPDDFVKAWTIDGYTIGRVDFQDLNAECPDNENINSVFRYVCKYLQKQDFDFEKLATIDYHRAFFQSMQYVLQNPDELFPQYSPLDSSSKEYRENWKKYIRTYSPFVVCSRRPSIGSQYLEDNLDRFKEQDFRLFGLPLEGAVFPRYYLRKTKESLCDFSALGSESKEPSTCSRLGYISSVLATIANTRNSIYNWSESPVFDWCLYKNRIGQKCIKLRGCNAGFPITDLSFYDNKNKFMYQFNGYNYNVWVKLKGNYALLDVMDITDVLSELSPSWDRYYKKMVQPFHDSQVLKESDLNNSIECMYKPYYDKNGVYHSSVQQFHEEVNARYRIELDSIYKRKLLQQNSKTEL